MKLTVTVEYEAFLKEKFHAIRVDKPVSIHFTGKNIAVVNGMKVRCYATSIPYLFSIDYPNPLLGKTIEFDDEM